MSEFVLLFRSTAEDRKQAMGTPERARESMQAFLVWMRELEAKGHLKEPGQPLEPSGKVVRGKEKVVTDGPYAEADLVLGFMVIRARDMAEAIELAGKCPIVEGGACAEIRPVMKSPLE
jgi:hypothetical protein